MLKIGREQYNCDVVGVDEVGRGPLAGPVVAAAVVFRPGAHHPRIRDSKKLSAAERESLAEWIREEGALRWSIVAVGHRRIDTLNIRVASRVAMDYAVQRVAGDLLLIDGNMRILSRVDQVTVIKGDTLYQEIAAAAILAKVARDALMTVLNSRHPGYGWERNAGYPTAAHLEALAVHGLSPVHRKSFGPCRRIAEPNAGQQR